MLVREVAATTCRWWFVNRVLISVNGSYDDLRAVSFLLCKREI